MRDHIEESRKTGEHDEADNVPKLQARVVRGRRTVIVDDVRVDTELNTRYNAVRWEFFQYRASKLTHSKDEGEAEAVDIRPHPLHEGRRDILLVHVFA